MVREFYYTCTMCVCECLRHETKVHDALLRLLIVCEWSAHSYFKHNIESSMLNTALTPPICLTLGSTAPEHPRGVDVCATA